MDGNFKALPTDPPDPLKKSCVVWVNEDLDAGSLEPGLANGTDVVERGKLFLGPELLSPRPVGVDMGIRGAAAIAAGAEVDSLSGGIGPPKRGAPERSGIGITGAAGMMSCKGVAAGVPLGLGISSQDMVMSAEVVGSTRDDPSSWGFAVEGLLPSARPPSSVSRSMRSTAGRAL